MRKLLIGAASALLPAIATTAAMAQEGMTRVGKPHAGGTGFQEAASEGMHDLVWYDSILHFYLLPAIVVLVCALMVWVFIRYNAKANPTPKRFTHNMVVEVVWTVVPVVILLAMIGPSLRILYHQLDIPDSEITIKAIGNQWYWSYEYPDAEISFDAAMLAKEDLAANGYMEDEYLLAADTAIVVPVNTNVRIQTTATDVIHSFALPALGVKMDAVPGRLNETWFNAQKEGVYFGQCSELCGTLHAYMPITLLVVSEDEYQDWLTEQQLAQGVTPTYATKLASAQPAAQ